MSNFVHRYPIHTTGRTFIVGDLHGCYTQLMSLLASIGFDFDNDLLYCTGDLGDRGPESNECFGLIGKKWFRTVRGNHDDMIVESLIYPYDFAHWRGHGGDWVIDSTIERRRELAAMVEKLPFVIVVGEGAERYNIFHAEFHGNDAQLDALDNATYIPLQLQNGRDLIRGTVDVEAHAGLSTSYVGHSIVDNVCQIGKHIYLDGGGFWVYMRETSRHGLMIVEPATKQTWKYKK